MGAYWVVQGGLSGRLIEIDRSGPLVARFQVDINAAGWPELSQLPDVSETLARRIVESRDTAGRYRDHKDLLQVKGIGPLTLEGMRQYLLPMPDQDEVAGDFVESVPVQ
jgi:competence protein ComEA